MALKRQVIGSGLVAAVERTWEVIRAHHPEVPAAVVIVGSGSEGRPRGLRLGHFAAGRWSAAGGGGTLGEVFVAGEGLDRGAADVLTTLLHEAAHALAHERGIADTSRQGRYHNRRFRALGEELGLHVERHPQLGWTLTTILPATARVYATELARLERALVAHRARELAPPEQRARDRNPVAAVCSCGRRIRVAAGVLARGPVICGVCHTPFAGVDARPERHVQQETNSLTYLLVR